MSRHCIGYVFPIYVTVPGNDQRLIARKPLKKPKRVLLQGHIKQDLDVVEKDEVSFGLIDDLPKDPRKVRRALDRGQVQHAPRQLEIDINQRCAGLFSDVLKRSRFPRARRRHHKN